jgi:hypothetical protein
MQIAVYYFDGVQNHTVGEKLRLSVKIVLGGLLCLFTAMSRAQDTTPISDIPTATISLTATLSPIPTYTATIEPTITEMDTATPFSTLDMSPSATLPTTLESSPIEVTPETTSELPTIFFTVTPTIQLATETVETTVISPTLTVTPSDSPTVTLFPMPIETVEISMIVIAGRAFYQNHNSDDSGIQISVLDTDGNLIGVTQTDANGQYSLHIPGSSSYQLVIEAFLHQPILLMLSGSEIPSDRVLAGGDLDADGCIGQLDLDLFMSLFNSASIRQGDITGDGVIDASDFAILAGNYQNNCPSIEPIPTASPLPVSPMPSPTLVESVTPENLPLSPTPEPTAVELTLSPDFAPTLTIDLTATPSFESAPEEI